MPLRERVAALDALIASTPFVTATSLSYEERPPSAGFIRGTIDFIDGSKLEFKEFLITYPSLRVIKYGYHYGIRNRLIFRYDNANDPRGKKLAVLSTPQTCLHQSACSRSTYIGKDTTRNRIPDKSHVTFFAVLLASDRCLVSL